MLYDVHVFALWIFLISVTLEQSWAQENGISDSGGNKTSGNGTESAFLCSSDGNCTCAFERLGVIVKCTSVSDKLEKIAFELPQRTTHL